VATDFNPRYVLYAKAHGEQPEDILLRDEEAYPGGKMCGFILWMRRRINEAEKERPELFFFDGRHSRLYDQVGFDKWLKARVDELLKEEELG
jgi:hypothetical protein